jgi:hypothetical protein
VLKIRYIDQVQGLVYEHVFMIIFKNKMYMYFVRIEFNENFLVLIFIDNIWGYGLILKRKDNVYEEIISLSFIDKIYV